MVRRAAGAWLVAPGPGQGLVEGHATVGPAFGPLQRTGAGAEPGAITNTILYGSRWVSTVAPEWPHHHASPSTTLPNPSVRPCDSCHHTERPLLASKHRLPPPSVSSQSTPRYRGCVAEENAAVSHPKNVRTASRDCRGHRHETWLTLRKDSSKLEEAADSERDRGA